MKFWRKTQVSQRQQKLTDGQDYDARMTLAEALPDSLAREDTRELAIESALALASDDNYYVAEKAVYALLSRDDTSLAFKTILETGTGQARALVLQAIRQLADERPDAVNESLIRAIARLLQNAESITCFVATKTLLQLHKTLPAQATSIRSLLEQNLQSVYSSVIDRFADKRFAPATVAGHLVDLCTVVQEAIDLVIASLLDDRPAVREGAARSIAKLGEHAARAAEILDEHIVNEPNWPARVWAAAAWEAVTGRTLPEACWPVVTPIWQMVFFETHNADAVPTGVRFHTSCPLEGVLKHEHGSLYLYWPDNHGVTSSERLLDNYGPISVHPMTEDDVSDPSDQVVEITGTYREHRISAETIKVWRRESREAT